MVRSGDSSGIGRHSHQHLSVLVHEHDRFIDASLPRVGADSTAAYRRTTDARPDRYPAVSPRGPLSAAVVDRAWLLRRSLDRFAAGRSFRGARDSRSAGWGRACILSVSLSLSARSRPGASDCPYRENPRPPSVTET